MFTQLNLIRKDSRRAYFDILHNPILNSGVNAATTGVLFQLCLVGEKDRSNSRNVLLHCSSGLSLAGSSPLYMSNAVICYSPVWF